VIVADTVTGEAPLPPTAGALTGEVVTVCPSVVVFDDDAITIAAVGTAAFEPTDGDEVPNALVAATVKVYESPPVRPVKVAVVPDTVCDDPDVPVVWSNSVTVYVVTALPEIGAAHVTSTSPTLLVAAVAVTSSGADGAVPVGAAAVTVTDAAEDVLEEKFGSPL